MLTLTREIRFSADRDWPTGEVLAAPVENSWAGWPGSAGLASFLRLQMSVTGKIDERLGYLCNIKKLDEVARREVVPLVFKALAAEGSHVSVPRLLASAWGALGRGLPAGAALARLTLAVSPYLAYTMTRENPSDMLVTEQFEFCAAHRLHCDELSPQENVDLFGKCNSPSGHGHNYVVEVTVAGAVDAGRGTALGRPQLERIVKRRVIDRFDHKNLNVDAEEFRDVNPTVENIARCIFELLRGEVKPARLAKVRVYESPKTWAEYTPAPLAGEGRGGVEG
ncbi:MAG: 6-carboxytetrahydropterin synthase [Planctomycetia bacterium]|nr:6-carboxytetrahydropterin synthase [Planctomycetia bacterium]